MPTAKTPLPDKLQRDVRNSWDEHAAALLSLIDRTVERHPTTSVRSQQRYSALYKGRYPFVYLEPQRDRILLGFFRDYVDRLTKAPALQPVPFPDWNTSKGGLVGYAIQGFRQDLPPVIAELERLVEESYRWA